MAWGCTPDANNQNFTCYGSAGWVPGRHDVDVFVDGTTSNNPTIWTLQNLSLSSPGLNPFCVPSDTQVGVWHGGLEAFVPFVKSDPANGYETYIVLYNRYDQEVPVYVTTFADSGASPVMIGLHQIPGKETIPAGGKLVITGADIGSFLANVAGVNYDMAEGIPVKFLLRVPSQMGPSGVYAYAYKDDTHLPDPVIEIQNSVNPTDPYIEGIVVSTYSNGQRSIPLKFKWFKNGEYNQ